MPLLRVRGASCAGWALLALLLARSVFAQDFEQLQKGLADQPFTIQADEISYVPESEVYEAHGNVVISNPRGASVRADWVRFSAQTRLGLARGKVEIRDGDDLLTAEEAEVDLTRMTAKAVDATLDTPDTGFLVEAGSLEKTGDDTYEVEEGVFTTCRCAPGDRRPWTLGVGEADLRVEGYAFAEDVTLCLWDLPVLYTPWLLFPVKTKRQSGFLFPVYESSSRDGTELELPFFWAARPNLNVLLRPRSIEERGFKGTVEAELLFGEEGYSEGGFSVLSGDDLVEENDPATRFSEDRWAAWLRHHQPLARGVQVGADLQRLSDNDYVVDFDDLDAATRSFRFLESKAWGTGARSGVYAGAELRWIDDLQSPNDLDRDHYLLQRLPDVRVAALPHSLEGLLGGLPLRAGFDLRYTYFYQDADRDLLGGNAPLRGQFFDTGPDGVFNFKEPTPAGTFDNADNHLDGTVGSGPPGPEGDGVYQEGELLADKGHRFEVTPRLSLPVQLGVVETLAEVGYRGALYDAERASGRSRGIVTGRIDARTRLEREFTLRDTGLTHVLEPGLAFAFVSSESQPRNPLFLPEGLLKQERLRSADLRTVTRSPSDRVDDERVLELSLRNRLFRDSRKDGAPPRQVAAFRLGSGYDFELDRQTNLFLEAEAEPAEGLHLEAEFGYDFKEDDVDEAIVRAYWSKEEEYHLGLDYRYLRNLPLVFENYPNGSDVYEEFDQGFDRVNQLSLDAGWKAHRRLELFGRTSFSFKKEGSANGQVGAIITGSCDCWDIVAVVNQSTRPSDTRFSLTLRIAGFGVFSQSVSKAEQQN